MPVTAMTLPAEVAARRSRAVDLRDSAATLEDPLAIAYRRRAAELELEAAVLAARLGGDDRLQPAA